MMCVRKRCPQSCAAVQASLDLSLALKATRCPSALRLYCIGVSGGPYCICGADMNTEAPPAFPDKVTAELESVSKGMQPDGA